ncbi:hypothetical protein DRF60_01130 [Chryseobacterium elymi]|uniref:Uncharacterized protein n=1 Tax=Chryseobacterium elymi TaxID=395936 RepID=A0A3D9DQQ4_9FLAO|nr:hypothetical protein [Chryseobacterium elymi]REC80344.1 hypothetical protein DRF60_01130 [Chryseobacterium elymi]
MMKIYFFFILLLPYYCFSQLKIPKGFSEFKESPSNGKEMKRIVADFDKDKKEDVITVIYQSDYELHAAKKYLIIYLSSKKKTFYIDFDVFNGVFVIPLKYKNDVLEFLVYQEGTGVYGHGLKLRFNQKVKDIQLIGYDYSYRTPGGHCNKTYNLLTGDYTVNNDFYNMKTDKTEFESFKGNKKVVKSIFIKDFSSDLFAELSSIGKKYERE